VTLKERVEALSGAPIFGRLSPASLQRVARTATEFDAPEGQVLIEPRMPGSGMFVLLEGVASVDVRGRASRDLAPGECFGELALLLPEGERQARVRAKTPVRCLALARDDFRSLLVSEPELALGLLETLAARLVANE
jgi:voltage-gated potassium channel